MISRLTLAEMRLAAAQYQLNIAQLHQELASGHPRSPHDHLQREVEDQQVRAADYALLIDLAEQHNDAEAMGAAQEYRAATVSDLARGLGIAPNFVEDYIEELLADGKLIVWSDHDVLSSAAVLAIRRKAAASRGGTHDTCRPEDCPWAGQ